MFFIRHLRRTQIQGCSIPLSSFSKPWTRDCLKLLCCSTQMKSASDGQLILKSFEGRAELMLAVRACLPPPPPPALQGRRSSLHWVIPPQSRGQQVLVLVPLLVFCSVLSQHRQPLRAGGDPAGSVQNQTQKKEKNGDKRVAADGYHSSCGQSCHGLLVFHH